MCKIFDEKSFESEVIGLARHIFAPVHEERINTMIADREHDAIFIGTFLVNAIETTVSKSAEKAAHDLRKLDAIIRTLDQEFRGKKTVRGWFITKDPLTNYQKEILNRHSTRIQHNSYRDFLALLIDTHGYLRARETYPFGSVQDPNTGSWHLENDFFVPSSLMRLGQRRNKPIDVDQLSRWIIDGHKTRILLEGDFGQGKSMHLKKLFEKLAQLHTRNKHPRFPVLLNVRDFAGLESPDEAFRRHAKRIGMSALGDNLIAAWKSDRMVLMLDGYDEVVPRRSTRNDQRARNIRHQALQLIRVFIKETPPKTPLTLAGRLHYFASEKEMADSLGVDEKWERLQLMDFNQQQLDAFLKALGSNAVIPSWVPMRPLLISYLCNGPLSGELSTCSSLSPSAGWGYLLDRICVREVEQIRDLPLFADELKKLIGGLAVTARKRPAKVGPVTLRDARAVYNQQFQDEAQGESLAEIMRMPGLISSTAPALDEAGPAWGEPTEDGLGSKQFISEDLVDVASADLLIKLAEERDYDGFRLFKGVMKKLGPAGVEAISRYISEKCYADTHMSELLQQINQRGSNIFAQLDIIEGMCQAGLSYKGKFIFIDKLNIDHWVLSETASRLGKISLRDCYITSLLVQPAINPSQSFILQECCIEKLSAYCASSTLDNILLNCLVQEEANDELACNHYFDLSLSPVVQLLCTILRKIYVQSVGGRIERALKSGVPNGSTETIDYILNELRRNGFLSRQRVDGEWRYHPVSDHQGVVRRFLENPDEFSAAHFVEM